MTIFWSVDDGILPPEGLLSAMQMAADCVPAVEGVSLPCGASLRLCNDEAIRAVNREYRRLDRATDVLSFPTVTYPGKETAGRHEKLLKREYDPETGVCFLGDIVISLPHMLAQAAEYGHSPQREGAYLLVHGLLHLLGYDHMTEEERQHMRNQEEKALAAAALSRDGSSVEALDERLRQLALQAMERSYSPYSHFPVGAALHCVDGRIFQGCNIENASFGLTNCAERTALFKAVSEGARGFDVLAIAANMIAWPCGACRQALNEFAPDLRVLVVSAQTGQTDEKNLRELLPVSFGPEDLA